MSMFQGQGFLIITSEGFQDPEQVNEIKQLLQNNGAVVVEKEEYNNNKNYLINDEDESTDAEKLAINHIIAESIQFIEYSLAIKSMIPITTCEWVRKTIEAGKPVNYKIYNPDPKFFFKDTFVCVADNLPIGDKEAIYGGIKAFGGNYLDVLTKYTTHLIAIDLSNEKSIIASSAIRNEEDNDENGIDIKIVLPHWIDHCITLGRKLDEKPYLLPNPPILNESNSTISRDAKTLIPIKELAESQDVISNFFNKKVFYISQDYNLSERLTNSLVTLIERQGGEVSKTFVVDSVDVYIGKYRTGEHYISSSKSNRIVVGNLQWLYHVIVTNKWVLPLNSSLLHYPVPNEPLESFKNLRISITNYSGDSRAYLVKLISTLGGTFTKTLAKDNHYLISAKDEGKKHLTAKEKWIGEDGNPKIKIVNHLWLEECFAQWKLVDYEVQKYQYFGNGKNIMESLIDRTKLDENVLKKWNGEDEEVNSQNVDDSMSEDEATQSKVNFTTVNGRGEDKEEESEEAKYADDKDKENHSFSPIVNHEGRLGGRAAAKRAALKLHNTMTDLNNYQAMAKSSRKMKTFMDELDGSTTPSKKSKADSEIENTPSKKAKISSQSSVSEEPKAKSQFSMDTVAIMTGSEKEITLTKSNIALLAEVGIQVLSDFPDSYSVNTLIAPKILRTEKFLRSLSKVDRIIHPKYLIEVIKKLEDSEPENYPSVFDELNLDDYELDKFISINELNSELGYPESYKKNGFTTLIKSDVSVFSGLNINLSSSLNGGVDVISRILQDHGMTEFSPIKNNLSLPALKKSIIETEIDGSSCNLLIAHKSKDVKLISNFKKLNESNSIVVEWDWCVKSIFKAKLEPFDNYRL
ncbi:regulator of Ty1 transposition [Scheffersomyces coipomensis]|uniref:regulator of Ty1 transposition n=1 Tax=Scheffersomyces coipomensis TaxID=1788519 RepID=UPI00315CB3B4